MPIDLATCDPSKLGAGRELDTLVCKFCEEKPVANPLEHHADLVLSPREWWIWRGVEMGWQPHKFPSTDPAYAGEARRLAACWNVFTDASYDRTEEGIGCCVWLSEDGDSFGGVCGFSETKGDIGRAEALATCRAIAATMEETK